MAENLILGLHTEAPYKRRFGLQDFGPPRTTPPIGRSIRYPAAVSPSTARKLSAATSKKVVVAREFDRNPDLNLRPAYPGVDISDRVYPPPGCAPAGPGYAVLLVSAELDEILSLSDRIAVMYNGKIVAVMPVEEADEHKLGFLMLGGRLEDYQAGEREQRCWIE